MYLSHLVRMAVLEGRVRMLLLLVGPGGQDHEHHSLGRQVSQAKGCCYGESLE